MPQTHIRADALPQRHPLARRIPALWPLLVAAACASEPAARDHTRATGTLDSCEGVVCAPPGACQAPGVCQPETGTCTYSQTEEGDCAGEAVGETIAPGEDTDAAPTSEVETERATVLAEREHAAEAADADSSYEPAIVAQPAPELDDIWNGR